jgi:lipopolysaccharide export system ATP-binding protein
MALLEVRGLVKFYGRRCVVNQVDFDVNAGEVVGLLGPNGAGKTTSFRMATGQLAPNRGRVHFNGADVTGLAMYLRARQGMGYLTQEKSVFRRLTVEQNILAILEVLPKSRTLGRPLNRKERWERTEKVLTQFGLTHVRKNSASRLSGGETRRLEIARCLVCEPLLVLLDEPFAAVDPLTKADIRSMVQEMANSGIGVLLTDHDVREVLKITTRSYLIKDGKVRTHGTPAQIIRDPIAITEYLGTGFNDNTFAGGSAIVDLGSQPLPAVARSGDRATTLGDRATTLGDRATTLGDRAIGDRATTLGDRATSLGDRATTPAPESPAQPKPAFSAAQLILEQEKLQRLVEALKSPEHAVAAGELTQRGIAAVPVLLAALERRDAELRHQVHAVLQAIFKGAVPFDPYAPEAVRRQQLAALRDQLERRAG